LDALSGSAIGANDSSSVANTSIVVINKDDPGIRETLVALSSEPDVRTGRAEVIVVDASEGRLNAIRDATPGVSWIAFTPLPGRSSIPHQRNVGVRASRGDTIVFIDASCVPDDNWLAEVLAPIRVGEEVAVAGAHRSTGGAGLRDTAIARRGSRRYIDEAPTINFAITRYVFDQLGGFDESFRYGSDVDLSWRLIDAGYRLRYAPRSVVAHDWGDARAEMRRSFAYGRARADLLLKHRSRWRRLLGPDLPALVYPVLLVLLPLLARRPRRLLILVVPLVRNRGHRPASALIDHFVYGAGVLRSLADRVRRS
jgi:cellulose synthase/poly-beta-1,6-N-acetylglucosamine synthase-like glycosyltransferase